MKQHVLNLLSSQLDETLVEKLIKRYDETQGNYLKGDWEGTLDKAGKFVEVTMKCLHFWRTGNVQERINVGNEITELGNLPSSKPRTLRILIPRACRIVYDLASNRGGRHDRTGFESNNMDATMAASGISWILAEFLRIFYPPAAIPDEAQKLADALITRKLPIIEEIDGKTFIDLPGASAKSKILALLHLSGGSLSKKEVIESAERHQITKQNVYVILKRLRDNALIFTNQQGVVHLLNRGQIEAEKIIKEGSQ